jgi:hypothetical protein
MPSMRKPGGGREVKREVVEVDDSDTEADDRYSHDEEDADDAKQKKGKGYAKKKKGQKRSRDEGLRSVSLGQLLTNQSLLMNEKATAQQLNLALQSTAVVAALHGGQRVHAVNPSNAKEAMPNGFFGGKSVRSVLKKILRTSQAQPITLDSSSGDDAIDLTGSEEADRSFPRFEAAEDPIDYLRHICEQCETAENMPDCAAYMRAEGIPWIHMSPLHPDEMDGDCVQVILIYCLAGR